MSSKDHRTTLQCPNCGSSMTVKYSGEMLDKQVVCKACDTAFDVPDNFERVRKVRRTQKGFFRKREVVEEEIHERRSDFSPPPPQQPQFQQPQGQPIVVNIPGARLSPSASTSGGGCVASLIILVVIVAVGAGIFAAVGSSIDSVVDSVSGVTGGHPIRSSAERTMNAHERSIEAVAFSPDGSKFISTSSSEWALWDMESGNQIRREEFDAFSADNPIFINNGEQFVIDNAGDLYFYNTADGGLVRRIDTRSGLGAVSPDYTQFAYVNGRSEGDLFFMELATERLQEIESLTYYVDDMKYTPDGKFLVIGGRDSTYAVYDVATGERTYLGRTGFDRLDEVVFKPNSNEFISFESDAVDFFEINESGVPTVSKSWSIDMNFISFSGPAVFSPDGTKLAVADFAGGVILWDATNDEAEIIEEFATERGVGAVAFSPDGKILLAGDDDGKLWQWELD